MKVVAIITEFNPFHKGHKYIIEKAKALTNSDYCIIITSGNYVQRGEPAFVDKYTKTEIALLNGADLVIELPTAFSTASAMYFGKCAVSILDSLNIVDYLAFGIEADNLCSFEKIVDILIDEPSLYKNNLKENLALGFSFPAARKKALSEVFPNTSLDFLDKPNSILGIEYLKALKELNSSIKPIGIKRINADYHQSLSNDDTNENRLFSASNIRAVKDSQLANLLADISPIYSENLFATFPLSLNNSFSAIAGLSILKATAAQNNYFDVPDYLFDKIKGNIGNYVNYSDFILSLKSKDISYTAISRALLHITLNITEQLIFDMLENNYGNYIRILGVKSGSEALLKELSVHCEKALLTNVKDYKKLLSEKSIEFFEHSLACEDIYRLCQTIDLKKPQPNEFQQKFIRI
mgnify:FL=1